MADQQITQLTQELSRFTDTLRQYVNAQSRTHVATKARTEHSMDITDQLREYGRGLVKNRILNEKQLKLYDAAFKAKQREITATQEQRLS